MSVDCEVCFVGFAGEFKGEPVAEFLLGHFCFWDNGFRSKMELNGGRRVEENDSALCECIIQNQAVYLEDGVWCIIPDCHLQPPIFSRGYGAGKALFCAVFRCVILADYARTQ